jgi:hypothetical protein
MTRSSTGRVGGQQGPRAVLVGLARDERRAQFAAALGAHRDVLQIGIARCESPGRGRGLAERAMHSSGSGIDESGQRVDVSALEFLHLAPFEQGLDHRQLAVVLGQRVEVGRPTRLRLLGFLDPGRVLDLEFLEQHFAERLGTVQVDLDPGQLGEFGLELRQFEFELLAELSEQRTSSRIPRALPSRSAPESTASEFANSFAASTTSWPALA